LVEENGIVKKEVESEDREEDERHAKSIVMNDYRLYILAN
jgi:hypothetical protein